MPPGAGKGGVVTEDAAVLGSRAVPAEDALSARFPGMRRWHGRADPQTPARWDRGTSPRSSSCARTRHASASSRTVGLTLPRSAGSSAAGPGGLVERYAEPADGGRTLVEISRRRGPWAQNGGRCAGPAGRVLDKLAPASRPAFLKAMGLLETGTSSPGPTRYGKRGVLGRHVRRLDRD